MNMPSPESPQQQTLAESATKTLAAEKAHPLPPNARTTVAHRLHRTVFFAKHPDATDLSPEEQQADTTIDAKEKAAKDAGPLVPTVGAEIESLMKPKAIDFLTDLGVEIVPEHRSDFAHGRPLWEVRTPWSYSSDTQIATVHQLYQLGAIPRIPGLGREELHDTHMPLSLHLNFGMPFPIADINSARVHFAEPIKDVVDALTLAFVSPERLEQRKTNVSYRLFDEAEPTDKTIPDPTAGPNAKVHRFEIRSLEVTDMLTPALIHSSQFLVAGLFATMMQNYDVVMTGLTPTQEQQAKQMAGVFKEFTTEFGKMREQHGNFPAGFMDQGTFKVNAPNQPGLKKDMTAAELLRELNVAPDFRKLVTEYAARIGRIAGFQEPPTPGMQQPPQSY